MTPMSPLVAIHGICALTTLVLGPIQILRPRRDRAHRILGRTWVVAMVLTCVLSFFIHPDGLSWLHGLAVFTLVVVTLAFIGIRQGNVARHRRGMVGAYLGTVVAFLFAVFVPTRLIPRTMRTEPLVILGTLALVVVFVLVDVLLVTRRSSEPATDLGVTERVPAGG